MLAETDWQVEVFQWMKIKGQRRGGGTGENRCEARNCNNQPHTDWLRSKSDRTPPRPRCQDIFLRQSQLLNRKTTLFLLESRGVGGLFQFPLNLEFMRKCWIAVYKCYLSDYWSDSSLSSVGPHWLVVVMVIWLGQMTSSLSNVGHRISPQTWLSV